MKTLTSLSLAALLATASFVAQAQPEYDQISRGSYIATLGDCTACHTTDATQPFAGGVKLQTPFGTLVGANITPDPATGIGNWNYDDFKRAMTAGIGHGGKRLYGAMPFTAYTKMSDADLRDLWAWMQTLQPIHHEVETNQLPFPFNIRSSLMVWNWINFDKGEFQPHPDKSAQWNRGAYLVEGPGHCGTCHTPKNLLGGDKGGQFLTGEVVEGWYAPNLTNSDHSGLGKWTTEDIVSYLRTGVNRFDIASGPMADAVSHSTQHWRDDDLQAVATYLKGGDKQSEKVPQPLPASDERMQLGAQIYASKCSACHSPGGRGEQNIFPQLKDNPLLNQSDATSLIRVVAAGSRGVNTDIRPTAPAMPSFAGVLGNDQIAAVVTYIRNSWGNAAAPVDATAVQKVKDNLQ
ncbi:c-type cytochrome [Pantoea phytobeneficialis]|uniref:Alcohol dehydrogenase n=1 Tax=Pantoea phytobeneficialis TaxID=2052056 RepID=A0AAP9KRP8_9GAMM|nr:cytochrome c [Pantoea phytobeneficialis]MDO6406756.1 cytochrome c [Pantoea phytobeneficialis]QGR09284.1 alcohol dehydrogenase [Pantoea phytobeneficialis]